MKIPRKTFISGLLLLAFVLLEPALLLARERPADITWEKEIQAFEARDRLGPPPENSILFIGSSSIRLWKTLADDFPGNRVINRGFGGSQIIDSVKYAERIVWPYRPKLIVMYAGGNDINSGKTADQVVADFKSFVVKVRAGLPGVRIAYISIAPNPARWSQVETVKAANSLISQYCQISGLEFIDVFHHMLGKDGLPLPDIFAEDRLHLNARGYALWRQIVAPYLK
jgi:lysophospholipase L1-like esterase